MANKINFFPTIDGYHYNLLNPVIKYNFFYFPKNEDGSIEIENTITSNRYITLSTNNNHWDPMNYDLNMIVTVEIENKSILYGINGVCPTNGELSIALEWYSQKSKKRDIIYPRNKKNRIDDNNEKSKYVFECTFNKNTFMNDIEINLIIYNSKKTRQIIENEKYLNNEEGVILGNIDQKTLFMTGTGSLFPIYLKSLDDNRLWNVQIEDCIEPEIDKFSDCVRIILNTNHKDYPLLDVTSKKYCERLILEIISNAVTLIICSLKESGVLDDINKPSSEGSVLNFIKYYVDKLELNIDNVVSISNSLRNYLDEKTKE